MPEVAIITGGAGGMGFAVAKALTQLESEEWLVHTIDLNASTGRDSAASINATFHCCDLRDYASVASIFKAVYQKHRRIDFVFANAGISAGAQFFPDEVSQELDEEPPAELDMLNIEVNLKTPLTTCWLAMHYFRLTKLNQDKDWEGNIVITASTAGVYGGPTIPMYATAKSWRSYHVRVNCICPGAVATPMTAGIGIPDEYMTPIENITGAVLMLIKGKAAVDSTGAKVEDGKMYGRAVEVDKQIFRFHDIPAFSDRALGLTLGHAMVDERVI